MRSSRTFFRASTVRSYLLHPRRPRLHSLILATAVEAQEPRVAHEGAAAEPRARVVEAEPRLQLLGTAGLGPGNLHFVGGRGRGTWDPASLPSGPNLPTVSGTWSLRLPAGTQPPGLPPTSRPGHGAAHLEASYCVWGPGERTEGRGERKGGLGRRHLG